MNIAETAHFLDSLRSDNISAATIVVGPDRYAELQRDVKAYLQSERDDRVKNNPTEAIEFMGVKLLKSNLLRKNEYVAFDSNGNIIKIAKI